MKKHNSVIILDVLLKGYKVVKDEETFRMSEEFKLVKQCEHYKGENRPEDKFITVDFGEVNIDGFIKWSNSFTEQEIITIVANKVLNKVK